MTINLQLFFWSKRHPVIKLFKTLLYLCKFSGLPGIFDLLYKIKRGYFWSILPYLKFEPFDNYGAAIPGMSWCKISYDKKAGGYGTYVLKMDPGAKSLPHKHAGHEEFLMLEGELLDADGKVFKKGDFVSFEPGSKHSSYTKNGCLVLVFMRGINEPI